MNDDDILKPPPKNAKEVLQSFTKEDLNPKTTLAQPCSKKALLHGVVAGLSLFSIRYLVSKSIRSSGNYAMIGFAISSVASWEFCRFQRNVVARGLLEMGMQEKREQIEKAARNKENRQNSK